MTKNRILALIRMLAKSKGFYGRLLNEIGYDGENVPAEWFEQFNACHDEVDFILTLEG